MSMQSAEDHTVRHRLNVDDVRPVMAKVVVKKIDEAAERAKYGHILARAVELAGYIDKQAADELGVDRAQFSRWLTGKENAQTWRFQSHDILGPALLSAQAEQTRGATIRTVIELERKVG
jgi:hypothetical protein